MVANPISTISRWKIFDNLRRSLVEPVTFLLLVAGWLFLPGGALYWTAGDAAAAVAAEPGAAGVHLGRACFIGAWRRVRRICDALVVVGFTLLNLTFLPHQMLLSLDAIVRSLMRRFVTGQKLLEWETAAQSESGRRQARFAGYVSEDCRRWSRLTIAMAAALTISPSRLLVASPMLRAVGVGSGGDSWLNSSPRA